MEEEASLIDILKDASLTAIYGAKGGNGVVVVTTKSAKEGKTTVSFNGSLTLSHISKQLDLMDPYNFVDYQYERAVAKGNSASNSALRVYRSNFGHPYDHDIYLRAPNHDWQDEVMGNTPLSYSANVSIGGGTENTRFNVSMTQSEDKGIIMGTGVRRTNINTKINAKLSKTVTFTFNPKFSYRRDEGEGGEHVGTGGIIDVLKYRPTNGLREFAFWDPATVDPDQEAIFAYTNPVGDIERNMYKKHSYEITNQASLEWKPIKGLTLRTEGAYAVSFADKQAFYAVGTDEANKHNNLPVAMIDKSQSNRYIWTNTVSYDWTLKDRNNFYFLLGQEIQNKESKSTKMQNYEFPHDITADKALSMMGMAAKQSSTSSTGAPNRMASFFGQINYNYDHKYLISFTAREDGTSFYAPGYKWGFFPSVSAGWVMSEEKFMEDLQPVISNLKLRVAIGKAGKNLTKADMWNYSYNLNSSGGPDFGGDTPEYGENWYGMSEFLPNPHIKWETTLTRNLAIDLAMFNSRLRITPEFYWNTTSDLLHQSQVLTNSGYAKQWRNIGQITNKGFELTIDGDILQGRDYSLSATLTLGANRMKVDKLNGSDDELWENAPRNAPKQQVYCLKVGEQMGLIYGFKYDGIYSFDEFEDDGRGYGILNVPKEGTVLNNILDSNSIGSATLPGKVKLKDTNGDGVIDETDRVKIGNTTPKLQGGFGINGRYRNFDFTANFTYFLDFDVYNATAQALSSSEKSPSEKNLFNILNKFSGDRWRYTFRGKADSYYNNTYIDGSADMFMELNANATMWNPADFCTNIAMDYFVEDGSFLRCNDITVGYTLPERISKKAGMSRLRFYGSVSNPFIITNYSGFDPEVDVMSGLKPSWDYNRYPRSRGYVLGVNVTF